MRSGASRVRPVVSFRAVYDIKPKAMPSVMENVSGIIIRVRKAGIASVGSFHSTFPAHFIIKDPTSIKAGAMVGYK